MRRLRFFTYFVLVYMLLAFVWWSVLLYTKNRDAFQAKSELNAIGMAAEGLINNRDDYYASARYQELRKQYKRQEQMILGETIFLVLSLLGGMYIIYRGYQQEVRSSQQQRNFLLSITHELKSPIASIRLILETINRRKDALSAAQMERLGQNGVKEADRLNKLVEDLLLSARLESAYQFHKEPVDLLEMSHSLIDRLKTQFPEAEFSVHSPPEIALVSGDRQALTSVMVNLLENAVKYSPASAVVEVSFFTSGEKTLGIDIRDQGIGIPVQERKRIFEKFYRVGSENTRKTKGTGLGLFIVSEIIKAHGGHIEVRENTPQGSVFSVQLPTVNQ